MSEESFYKLNESFLENLCNLNIVLFFSKKLYEKQLIIKQKDYNTFVKDVEKVLQEIKSHFNTLINISLNNGLTKQIDFKLNSNIYNIDNYIYDYSYFSKYLNKIDLVLVAPFSDDIYMSQIIHIISYYCLKNNGLVRIFPVRSSLAKFYNYRFKMQRFIKMDNFNFNPSKSTNQYIREYVEKYKIIPLPKKSVFSGEYNSTTYNFKDVSWRASSNRYQITFFLAKEKLLENCQSSRVYACYDHVVDIKDDMIEEIEIKARHDHIKITPIKYLPMCYINEYIFEIDKK